MGIWYGFEMQAGEARPVQVEEQYHEPLSEISCSRSAARIAQTLATHADFGCKYIFCVVFLIH